MTTPPPHAVHSGLIHVRTAINWTAAAGQSWVSLSKAAGSLHGLGLKADGSIVTWGHNYSGQCNVPSPNTGFVALAGGGGHSLGLKVFYGDLNCDGAVNFDDTNPFVMVLAQ